jgi:hypothetical protein
VTAGAADRDFSSGRSFPELSVEGQSFSVRWCRQWREVRVLQ